MKGLPIKRIQEAYEEELQYIKGRFEGKITSLKCPWNSWNDVYMNGFEWGWIVTIAGRSGSGKTAIWNILETGFFEENPKEDFEILSFNFEMLARRLIGRKVSSNLGKSVRQVYSADIRDNITQAEIQEIESSIMDRTTKYPIHYVENAGSPAQVGKTITEFIKTRLAGTNKGLIVSLDHATLVKRMPGFDERATLMELMTMFNQLKKFYPKSIFFVLSQLNRNIEHAERRKSHKSGREAHYPTKGDIFGSDALYQFSDAVIVPHMPGKMGILKYGPDELDTYMKVFCHHMKNRDGEPLITVLDDKLEFNKLTEIDTYVNKRTDAGQSKGTAGLYGFTDFKLGN